MRVLLLLLLLLVVAGRGAFPDKARVPKCCPEGHSLLDDRDCHFTNLTLELRLGPNATAPAAPDSFVLVYGNPCKAGKFPLDPTDPDDHYFLLANGSLVVPASYPDPLGPANFCMETMWEEGGPITVPFICFPELSRAEATSMHFIIYPAGLLISVPFLLATVVVYCTIPELRDVNGKALCCYSSCLAVAYLFLACVQLGGEGFSSPVCMALAYIIQFSFMACFFWLNILCIDTFWCIMAATGAVAQYPGLARWRWEDNKNMWVWVDNGCNKERDKVFARKVFAGYSVYAWSLPVILIIIVMTMDLHPTIPSSYIKPNMGYSACWFSSEQAALRYFYGPIACLLLINVALFIITMYKLIRFTWNPRGSHRTPKQKARMCLMLFLVMGVSWVMEIVSWAVGGPLYVWVVTDAFNVLQGVVIFCIFVLEPRVKYLVRTKLWDRLAVIMGKYSCCGRQAPYPESPLPSPQPDEDHTMLTILDDSRALNTTREFNI